MIDLEEKQERVLLAGVETAENFQAFESSMIELAELTKTAGGLVIDQFTQKRERPDSRTMIGSGKLEQMRWAIEVGEIDTVIFNDRLSPRQNVNLEEALGVKVIDRMQLILDIFAMRARSHEGMLQVEEAQLNYLLPRLVGQGILKGRVKPSLKQIDVIFALELKTLIKPSKKLKKQGKIFVKNARNQEFFGLV